jgi:thioredoxin-like negative regulator of GroEL
MSNQEMTPLPNQEFFESLIAKGVPHDKYICIKFGATWCGPCKRLNMERILAVHKNIVWYECDLDENDYTPGYCGIKTIPAFLMIVDGKPQPVFQSSDTEKVIEWLQAFL